MTLDEKIWKALARSLPRSQEWHLNWGQLGHMPELMGGSEEWQILHTKGTMDNNAWL